MADATSAVHATACRFFRFADPLPGDVFVMTVPPGLHTKAALLSWFEQASGCPAPLGGDWNALLERMRDFSWIPARSILIRHADLPLAGDTTQCRIYLELLADAADARQGPATHEVLVEFPVRAQAEIRRVLEG